MLYRVTYRVLSRDITVEVSEARMEYIALLYTIIKVEIV
jgi:hypothetical protein